MKSIIHLLLLLSLACISFKTNRLEEESLKLYLPSDLKVELWAESPMLYNPTNMDTDLKGRIWVTEGVNYRNFNNDSTQFFHQNKGDRIMILSDTDEDGKADDAKVFVQDKDLIAPLGIAVFGKEIIVSCAPYLIKYTDEDGDDKPDKKEILLKGFGGVDHDHSLHSVVAGPDGRWHFSVGNAGPHLVTDKAGFTIRSGSIYTGGTPYNLENKGNQKSDDGKVWVGGLQMSLKPDATGLKVLGHNFRNSYETYVDGNGDMWQNDNDDQVVTCRVSWLVEGGNAGYFSEDGTRFWNADQRPGQNMFTAHWHQQDPAVMPAGDNSGAGSPTGMLRIEGDRLGAKYQGMVLSCDAGRNALFAYQPKINKSGFDLGPKSILLSSNPADDPGYQWNNKNFTADKTKWFRPSDALIGTDGALYVADWYDAVVGGHQMKDQKGYGRIYRISPKNKKLLKPNLDLTMVAGQKLAFQNSAINVRYQAYLAIQNTKNISLAKQLLNDSNPFTKSRALWLLATLGDKGVNLVKQKLIKGTENEQIVAIRALRQQLSSESFSSIVSTQLTKKSPFVKREAILGLQNLSFDQKNKIIRNLCQNTPLQDKYFLNAISFSLGNDSNQFYMENKNWAENNFPLMFTLHPVNAVSYFVKIAENKNELYSKREQAITAIGFIKSKEAVNTMLRIQKSPESRLKDAANYWLAFRSTNDWADLYDFSNEKQVIENQKEIIKITNLKERILNENIAFNDRKWAALDMIKSKQGAQTILDLYKENKLSADIVEQVIPALLNHSDVTVKYLTKSVINAEQKLYDKNLVNSAGDFSNGQTIFKNNCLNCHKMGAEGQNIGPELTKIHEKLDKNGLFEALTFPSSSIVFGYETVFVKLKSGANYYGFIISENEKNITMKDISNQSSTILKSQIVTRTKDKKSIMPSASNLQIEPDQLKDLLEYLAKNK